MTAAAHTINSGTVALNVTPELSGIRIAIHTLGSKWASQTATDTVVDHVQMAQRFADLFNGTVEFGDVNANTLSFNADLHFPLDGAIPVLVIDDNEDILRLTQRYLTGTSFRFIGARNPDEALNLVKDNAPRAVLMDVMLPGINDWELLGQLRVHPALQGVPIIVCTILPQEDLAFALGAAAYLRKPINREVLLSTLDQIVHRSSKVS
jgi:CheY-like chemotaxis protein